MSSHRRHLLACLLLGCSCSGSGGSGSGGFGAADSADTGAAADAGGSGPAGQAEDTPPPGVTVPRGTAHREPITEVWLDPRASAALTLDAGGEVRLWPALPTATEDLAALAPIQVPLRDPTALSLARADAGAFVIAAIDAVQSGRVLEVELDEHGQARVRERFAIPPGDPLLELRALDGGDRLLALGVDHRLTLYDRSGRRVAELAEHGFVPWQLRVAGPAGSPSLAVILVGPTRIQRISIADDHIARVGDPLPFTLDRGPNQNDLALLPSGRGVVALRRPKAHKNQWSVEVREFGSEAVRVMWGEAESNLRPRMYVIDDGRVLLEDGSGAGWWLELDAGAQMPPPFQLPAELESLPPEARVTPRRVALPSAALLPGRKRWHTTLVAGLRAVPGDTELIVDPVEADHHFRLGHTSIHVPLLALDHGGDLLAYRNDDGIHVHALADRSTRTVEPTGADKVWLLAFTDPDHLLLVDHTRARILAWTSGEVASELELPDHSMFAAHLAEPGAGVLGLSLEPDSYEDGELPDMLSAPFTANAFAELEPVPRERSRELWPELDQTERTLALDRTGRRYATKGVDVRAFDIIPPEGDRRQVTFADDKRSIEVFAPTADGRHVAIVHEQEADYGYEYGYDTSVLSIWSLAGEQPEHAWTIPFSTWQDLAWSGDGSRLAFEQDAGARVVTPDGETVAELVRGPLELVRRED